MTENIGKALKAHKEEKGKTRKELAGELGCSEARIAQILKGEIPSVELRCRIEALLGNDPYAAWYRAYVERLKKLRDHPLSDHSYGFLRGGVANAKKQIKILGTSAQHFVSIHRRELRSFLLKGGDLKVAVLDPRSEAFALWRRDKSVQDDERLPVGRTTYRLDFQFGLSLEILKTLHNRIKKADGPGKVELRLYDTYPDRSFTILDDAMLVYSKYELEGGERKEVVRVCWDANHDIFKECKKVFLERWKSMQPVNLENLADAPVECSPVADLL